MKVNKSSFPLKILITLLVIGVVVQQFLAHKLFIQSHGLEGAILMNGGILIGGLLLAAYFYGLKKIFT